MCLRLAQLSCAAAMAACTLAAQPEPTFEVASIWQMEARGGGDAEGATCIGDRFTVRGVPLSHVFTWAFGVASARDRGEPDWVNSAQERYAIETKAAVPMTPAECKRMVIALLRDRFQLKYHEEMREADAFDLVVHPNGHKMRVVTADTPPVRINGSPLGIPAGAPKGYQAPRGLPMSALTGLLDLAPPVERKPVVDKTGLQGNFGFDLEFSLAPNDNRQDVFSAVQDQLGLKLAPSKTQVKTIVVESIQRPSEN